MKNNRPTWTGRHINASALKVGDCFLTRGNNVLQVLDIAECAEDEEKLAFTLQNKINGKSRSSNWWKNTAVFLIKEDE